MSKREPISFEGTLIEGPNVNLLELAGVKLDEATEQRLWDNINARDLLLLCPSCEEILLEEVDEFPGMSDSFFEYQCGDRAQLAIELAASIRSVLDGRGL
jgi:hypothetical protein